MEYRKEKNLLIAFENNTIKGQYDWVENISYGAKGTPIKTVASAFKASAYDSMITSIKWIHSHLSGITLARAIDRWERLASVGLYTTDHDLLTNGDYEFPNLKKDFVLFLQENFHCELSQYAQSVYHYRVLCPEFELLNANNKNHINGMINDNPFNMPIDWTIKALFRLQMDDFDYLYNKPLSLYLLEEYYKQCKILGQEEPAITKNFLITICKTGHMYSLWKKNQLNENLKKYNDVKELYYENDNYIMYPLLTTKQFHDEAEQQQNCVERLYMEKVAAGSTHVVVIRKKNNPSQSLITCEISHDWKIIQYYAKWNRFPETPEYEFKQELNSYLKSLSQN